MGNWICRCRGRRDCADIVFIESWRHRLSSCGPDPVACCGFINGISIHQPFSFGPASSNPSRRKIQFPIEPRLTVMLVGNDGAGNLKSDDHHQRPHPDSHVIPQSARSVVDWPSPGIISIDAISATPAPAGSPSNIRHHRKSIVSLSGSSDLTEGGIRRFTPADA